MDSLEEFKAKYEPRPDSIESFKKRYPDNSHLNILKTTDDFFKKYPVKEGEPSELEKASPYLAGAWEGFQGKAPDEVSGSVLDPNHESKVAGAKLGFGAGTALAVLPTVAPLAKGILEAPGVTAGGRAAQRGYIRGELAEGADSAEARAARFKARTVDNPGTQSAAMTQWGRGTDPTQKWWQGGDKKWRNEVSDAEARVKIGDKYDIPTVLKNKKKVEMTLADAYDHPELFKDYPALAKYRVVVNPKLEKNYRGAFTAKSNVIEISPKLLEDPAQLKETIVHEVQHAVDDLEGTSAGAPLNWLKWKYGDEEGTRRYRNNAGEAMARSQENRTNMTAEQRAEGPAPFSNKETRANYRELDWSKDSTGDVVNGAYASEAKPAMTGGPAIAGGAASQYNTKQPEGSSK